jgi:hypothetical protein
MSDNILSKDKPMQITIGSAIVVVLFVISSSVWFLNLKETIEGRVDRIEYEQDTVTKLLEKQDTRLTAVENNDHTKDLKLTELTIKLQNMETILIEIKTLVSKKS